MQNKDMRCHFNFRIGFLEHVTMEREPFNGYSTRKPPYCQDMRVCISCVVEKYNKAYEEATKTDSSDTDFEEGTESLGFWTLSIVRYSKPSISVTNHRQNPIESI
jgi:hypothetical protein